MRRPFDLLYRRFFGTDQRDRAASETKEVSMSHKYLYVNRKDRKDCSTEQLPKGHMAVDLTGFTRSDLMRVGRGFARAVAKGHVFAHPQSSAVTVATSGAEVIGVGGELTPMRMYTIVTAPNHPRFGDAAVWEYAPDDNDPQNPYIRVADGYPDIKAVRAQINGVLVPLHKHMIASLMCGRVFGKPVAFRYAQDQYEAIADGYRQESARMNTQVPMDEAKLPVRQTASESANLSVH